MNATFLSSLFILFDFFVIGSYYYFSSDWLLNIAIVLVRALELE